MSDTDNNNHAACVRKYLDANLAHITEEEFDALPGGEGVTCELRDQGDGPYGAWVFVNWNIGDISADGFPNLRRLMMLAKGLGCNWICLDVDGPYLDGVPTYDEEGADFEY